MRIGLGHFSIGLCESLLVLCLFNVIVIFCLENKSYFNFYLLLHFCLRFFDAYIFLKPYCRHLICRIEADGVGTEPNLTFINLVSWRILTRLLNNCECLIFCHANTLGSMI